jgi:hypothetical protein
VHLPATVVSSDERALASFKRFSINLIWSRKWRICTELGSSQILAVLTILRAYIQSQYYKILSKKFLKNVPIAKRY